MSVLINSPNTALHVALTWGYSFAILTKTKGFSHENATNVMILFFYSYKNIEYKAFC